MAYCNPYQAFPSGPIGPGGYPYPAPAGYGACYGLAGGAWFALLIILFVIIIIFGSFWFIGNQFC
ncbi:hypothetical protein [Niallia sp. 01092]|uniref:hypothetical protein n=1 Tax=unclassified Niallia TaxID=2837522 RepID=UPI003FD48F83